MPRRHPSRRKAQRLCSPGVLWHMGIIGIIVLTGYWTGVSMTMNFHAVAPGTPGLAR